MARATPMLITVQTVPQLGLVPAIYGGTFRAESSLQVTFPKSGTLARLGPEVGTTWKNGDHVPRGAVLAALDNSVETAQLRAAEARRDELKEQHEKDRTLFSSGTITRQQLDASANEWRAAEVAVRQARTLLDELEVRAPFDGIVQRRSAAPGEHVMAGSVIMVVDDKSTIRFEAQLSARVTQDALVVGTATLLYGGRRIPASVDGAPFLARTSDELFTLRFRAELPIAVRPGETARVELPRRPTVSAHVSIPASALTFAPSSQGQVPKVLRLDADNRVIPHAVEVVGLAGESVSVRGIEPGARILARAGGDLYEGMLVQPRQP